MFRPFLVVFGPEVGDCLGPCHSRFLTVGGHHKNIFAVNLGQLSLDRDIKILVNEISQL